MSYTISLSDGKGKKEIKGEKIAIKDTLMKYSNLTLFHLKLSRAWSIEERMRDGALMRE